MQLQKTDEQKICTHVAMCGQDTTITETLYNMFHNDNITKIALLEWHSS